MNARKAIWFSMLSEFDFEVKYIKGKENKVVDALSRRIQVNHLEVVSSYMTNLIERVKSVGIQEEKYHKVKEKLLQSGEDVEYHLIEDSLIRFKGIIYVTNNDEMKTMIMKESHAKPCSGHLGYQKTLTTIEKHYCSLNLKKEVADFMTK